MNADPSLEEAAENMGATRFQVVKNVTLPLALPGIASGSILVLILSMEDLGTPAIFAGFGDLTARKTITYYILSTVRQSLSETGRLPAELSILSAFLLILSIIGFFMIRRYTEKRQYSMISKGRAGTFRTANPNILYLIAIYSYFIILLTLSLIPHIGIFIASLTEPGILPLKWSTSNYQELFDLENGFGSYIKNTMIFSLISTGVIVILATMAGYVANRKQFTGRSAFDTMITIPLAIPGVVLGIGFILLFGGTDAIPFGNIQLTFNPLIYAPIILIISYTIRKFPFTVRAVYAGLQQTDAVLEEAAHNLGASKGRTIYNVIIPLIVLNIVAGALIALVYNMSEVSTTLILVNTQTHGTVTWAMADANGKIGALAAMGMFLMFLQALSLFITNVLLKNRAEAITGI
ncbi:MAG: ABC transporter permease [Candidatus Kariarchaeum pelagius]